MLLLCAIQRPFHKIKTLFGYPHELTKYFQCNRAFQCINWNDLVHLKDFEYMRAPKIIYFIYEKCAGSHIRAAPVFLSKFTSFICLQIYLKQKPAFAGFFFHSSFKSFKCIHSLHYPFIFWNQNLYIPNFTSLGNHYPTFSQDFRLVTYLHYIFDILTIWSSIQWPSTSKSDLLWWSRYFIRKHAFIQKMHIWVHFPSLTSFCSRERPWR